MNFKKELQNRIKNRRKKSLLDVNTGYQSKVGQVYVGRNFKRKCHRGAEPQRAINAFGIY